MRPRRCPPATTEELLRLLRRTRLLDDEALRRLGDAWPGGDDPQPHVEELVRAGLVTRYQGEQLLAGRSAALRLGPYRLLDRLGRGGMGQVFKAEHLLLRRLVALKVLGKARRAGDVRPPVCRDHRRTDVAHAASTPRRNSGRLTQVRREIETAGQLSHPNIIAAHDARRLRGRMVLVLEYVDGVDLERLVSETGPLPVVLAVEVARQAALALGYLHEQRLVHRDVKPANLILTHPESPGGAPAVKLLDLGLACPAAQAGGELCGTPDYLAPERGLSPDATDIRSDVYSLGCTLYHLLTGRVPFPGGGGWTGKLLRHRIEVPEPVGSVRPDVPPAVASLVERLMARDPAERFATPAEVVAAIETLPAVGQAASPVLVEGEQRQARPPVLRRRALLVTLCLVAVVLGGGAGNMARKGLAMSSSTPLDALPRQEASSPPAQPQRVVEPAPVASPLPNLIESASDGAVVIVPAGRHLVPPIQLRGKRLTLRGATGARPVLVRAAHTSWDALLQADRDLTLENLELHGGDSAGPPAPLVAVESAALVVRDCSLTQSCTAPALSVRRGALVSLERTGIAALEQGVAIEAPSHADGRVVVRDVEVSVRGAAGPAILLWATDAAPSRPLQVELTGSKLRAGRVVACRSLTGPVTLQAADNHLLFRQALVSLDGHRGDWRDRLTWLGRQNRCETTGPWLRLDGRPGAAWDETAFAQLWSGRR